MINEATGALADLIAENQYELPQEQEAPAVITNVPPPMRAFSVARSYFGGQKRPSDGANPPLYKPTPLTA